MKQKCSGNCALKLEMAVILISEVLIEHEQNPTELFSKLAKWVGDELMRISVQQQKEQDENNINFDKISKN